MSIYFGQYTLKGHVYSELFWHSVYIVLVLGTAQLQLDSHA